MNKWLWIALGIVFAFGVYLGWQYVSLRDDKLHVIFCDVGQGDAILVKTPQNQYLLFDAGPDKSVLWCLARHMPLWQRTIALSVLSHPHADHYFGLYFVSRMYHIKAFVTEALQGKSSSFQEIMHQMAQQVRVQYVTTGSTLQVDGVEVRVLSPSQDVLDTAANGMIGESTENISVITHLSYHDFDVLLTGDAPIESAKQYVGDLEGEIEVLQSPHHGSKTGMDVPLLEMLHPRLVAISVGANNRYGHPHKQVLDLYTTYAIPVLRTDLKGDIEIVSDGKGWWVR